MCYEDKPSSTGSLDVLDLGRDHTSAGAEQGQGAVTTLIFDHV